MIPDFMIDCKSAFYIIQRRFEMSIDGHKSIVILNIIIFLSKMG